jgi:hypothetical protein
MLLYSGWGTFARVLNFTIWRLNGVMGGVVHPRQTDTPLQVHISRLLAHVNFFWKPDCSPCRPWLE